MELGDVSLVVDGPLEPRPDPSHRHPTHRHYQLPIYSLLHDPLHYYTVLFSVNHIIKHSRYIVSVFRESEKGSLWAGSWPYTAVTSHTLKPWCACFHFWTPPSLYILLLPAIQTEWSGLSQWAPTAQKDLGSSPELIRLFSWWILPSPATGNSTIGRDFDQMTHYCTTELTLYPFKACIEGLLP